MTSTILLLTVTNLAVAQHYKDVQYINELPIDNLLRLKHSIEDLTLTTTDNDYLYGNLSVSALDTAPLFGAQALHLKSPIKRTEYDVTKKGDNSKISNIFAMTVTTLAFLAFGGYLLSLIVQSLRTGQVFNPATVNPTQATFLIANSGLKRRPQPQYTSSYGRKKRDLQEQLPPELDLPPEHLLLPLMHFCEGYVKWSASGV